MNTVHVDMAALDARCPTCRLAGRPLWWVGRKQMCASCTTAALAGRAVSFGTVLCSRRKNPPIARAVA